MSGALGGSLFMAPYRPFAIDSLSPSEKSGERRGDSGHVSDGCDDSPNRDKDSD